MSNLKEKARGLWDHWGIEGGDRESCIADLSALLEAVVAEEREAAIKDVCMYCAGRAIGWDAATGPNSAGNWTHENPHYSASRAVLCAASSIFSRARGLKEKQRDAEG